MLRKKRAGRKSNMELLARNLKFLRKAEKLTLRELSEGTGISTSALSEYELAQKNPSLHTAKVIASYFGISIDRLVYGDLYRESQKDNDRG